jgi:hypothetical protein
MKRRNWIHEYGGKETELLYRQYYGDFEIVGRKAVTEIEVTGQRVFPQDLSIIGALITLIDQKLARQAAGDAEALNLLQAVFLPPDQEEGPVVHASLGSPGNVLVESVRRRAAPVLKVIVVLALGFTGNEIWDMVQANELQLVNSQALQGAGGEERWSCFFDQFAARLRWIRVLHQAAIFTGSVLLAWTSSGVKMPWVEWGRSAL